MVPRVLEHVAVDAWPSARSALATSSAAPPPRPITASARCALNAAAPRVDLAGDRVAPDVRNTRRRRGPAGRRRTICEQRQRRDAAVGDDQRALDALRLEVLGDQLARAGAEMDGGGKSESVNGHCVARRCSDDFEIALQFPVGDARRATAAIPTRASRRNGRRNRRRTSRARSSTSGNCASSRSACAARAECSRRPGWCRGSAWR